MLSDYQVVVIGVDDQMIKQKIVNRELIKVDKETILVRGLISLKTAFNSSHVGFAMFGSVLPSES